MRTLIIKGSEWSRGNGLSRGRLKDDTGFCCLGLDAIDRQIPVELLEGTGSPWSLYNHLGEINSPKLRVRYKDYFEDWLEMEKDFNELKEVTNDLMLVNDEFYSTDEQRIDLMRPLFESVGIEIDWRPEE